MSRLLLSASTTSPARLLEEPEVLGDLPRGASPAFIPHPVALRRSLSLSPFANSPPQKTLPLARVSRIQSRRLGLRQQPPTMAAASAEVTAGMAAAIRDGFAELEWQQELLATCTRLEHSLEGFVSLALSRLESLTNKRAREQEQEQDGSRSPKSGATGVAEGLAALCAGMEVDALRGELPAALNRCVDPARFAMYVVSEVFPVDRRAVRSPTDLAWVSVLILEAVVPVLADPDPEIGAARPMAAKAARERARGMAAE